MEQQNDDGDGSMWGRQRSQAADVVRQVVEDAEIVLDTNDVVLLEVLPTSFDHLRVAVEAHEKKKRLETRTGVSKCGHTARCTCVKD